MLEMHAPRRYGGERMKFHDQEIEALHKRGYLIEKKTPYQFRVECVLDLYPKRKRFHNIANQERGEYPFGFNKKALHRLIVFVDAQIKAADEVLDHAIRNGELGELKGTEPGQRRQWLNTHNEPWFTKIAKQVSA